MCEIRVVDTASDAEVAAWHEVMTAVELSVRGEHATPYALVELVAQVRTPRRDRSVTWFVAREGDAIVGVGSLELPLLDNLATAHVGVWVPTAHRRRGHGSALVNAIEAAARAQARSKFEALVDWPLDGPADGVGAPCIEFGRVHGYRLGLAEIQRELALPVTEDVLIRLEDEVGRFASSYRMRTVVGRFPDEPELLLSRLQLSSRLNTEAPAGEMEWEDQAVDPEAFGLSEAVNEASERTPIRAMALDAAGTVVAHSDLMVPRAVPGLVFQWGTLVDPAHRGHRLGLAVKLATLRELQRLDGGRWARDSRIVTWNAEVNEPMIHVNEQLGFRPVFRSGELFKKD